MCRVYAADVEAQLAAKDAECARLMGQLTNQATLVDALDGELGSLRQQAGAAQPDQECCAEQREWAPLMHGYSKTPRTVACMGRPDLR